MVINQSIKQKSKILPIIPKFIPSVIIGDLNIRESILKFYFMYLCQIGILDASVWKDVNWNNYLHIPIAIETHSSIYIGDKICLREINMIVKAILDDTNFLSQVNKNCVFLYDKNKEFYKSVLNNYINIKQNPESDDSRNKFVTNIDSQDQILESRWFNLIKYMKCIELADFNKYMHHNEGVVRCLNDHIHDSPLCITKNYLSKMAIKCIIQEILDQIDVAVIHSSQVMILVNLRFKDFVKDFNIQNVSKLRGKFDILIDSDYVLIDIKYIKKYDNGKNVKKAINSIFTVIRNNINDIQCVFKDACTFVNVSSLIDQDALNNNGANIGFKRFENEIQYIDHKDDGLLDLNTNNDITLNVNNESDLLIKETYNDNIMDLTMDTNNHINNESSLLLNETSNENTMDLTMEDTLNHSDKISNNNVNSNVYGYDYEFLSMIKEWTYNALKIEMCVIDSFDMKTLIEMLGPDSFNEFLLFVENKNKNKVICPVAKRPKKIETKNNVKSLLRGLNSDIKATNNYKQVRNDGVNNHSIKSSSNFKFGTKIFKSKIVDDELKKLRTYVSRICKIKMINLMSYGKTALINLIGVKKYHEFDKTQRTIHENECINDDNKYIDDENIDEYVSNKSIFIRSFGKYNEQNEVTVKGIIEAIMNKIRSSDDYIIDIHDKNMMIYTDCFDRTQRSVEYRDIEKKVGIFIDFDEILISYDYISCFYHGGKIPFSSRISIIHDILSYVLSNINDIKITKSSSFGFILNTENILGNALSKYKSKTLKDVVSKKSIQKLNPSFKYNNQSLINMLGLRDVNVDSIFKHFVFFRGVILDHDDANWVIIIILQNMINAIKLNAKIVDTIKGDDIIITFKSFEGLCVYDSYNKELNDNSDVYISKDVAYFSQNCIDKYRLSESSNTLIPIKIMESIMNRVSKYEYNHKNIIVSKFGIFVNINSLLSDESSDNQSNLLSESDIYEDTPDYLLSWQFNDDDKSDELLIHIDGKKPSKEKRLKSFEDICSEYSREIAQCAKDIKITVDDLLYSHDTLDRLITFLRRKGYKNIIEEKDL